MINFVTNASGVLHCAFKEFKLQYANHAVITIECVYQKKTYTYA